MKLFASIVPILALLLLSSEPVIEPRPAYAESLNLNVIDTTLYFEYTLDGAEHIGYMPRLDVELVDQNGIPVIGTVCGQWYLDNEVAPAPNIDIPQSYYCRKTDENGNTFFAYRYRYLDYVDVNLQFKVLELHNQTNYLYPNNFISMGF